MTTKAVLDAIQTNLQSLELVKKTSVIQHAGKFTWSELSKRSFNAPALFITCLGMSEAKDESLGALVGFDLAVDCRFAIGVVTKNAKNSEARNMDARLIAENILLNLIQQDWALENVLTPSSRRAEGLFVPAAEAENCSMWLVTWSQAVGLSKEDLAANIADFLQATGEASNANGDLLISSDTELQQ